MKVSFVVGVDKIADVETEIPFGEVGIEESMVVGDLVRDGGLGELRDFSSNYHNYRSYRSHRIRAHPGPFGERLRDGLFMSSGSKFYTSSAI